MTDPTIVLGPRILAIRAEPPEAAPGSTVHLDALVADVGAALQPAFRIWSICNPDPTQGVSSCSDASRRIEFATGATADFTVPADALAAFPPDVQEKGIELTLALEIDAVENGGPSLLGVKSVHLSTSTTPNANPSIASLTVNGGAPPADLPEGDLTLAANAAPGSAEHYTDDAGDETEHLTASWFVSQGGTEDPTSPFDDTTLSATTTWHRDTGGVSTLWVIVRDPRGGNGWFQLGPH